MGASESVPQKSIHEFTVKVRGQSYSHLYGIPSLLLLLLLLSVKSEMENGVFWFWGVQDYRGNDVDLGLYKGKVLLVVNVASKWYFSALPFDFFFFILGLD